MASITIPKSLSPIRRRTRDGKEVLYRRPSGARLVYTLTLPDRTRMTLTRWFSDRGRRSGADQARALLQYATQLEEWSRLGPLPPAAVRHFRDHGLLPARALARLGSAQAALGATWDDALRRFYERSVRDDKPKPRTAKLRLASRLLGLAIRDGKIERRGRPLVPWASPADVTAQSVRDYLERMRDTERATRHGRTRYTASTVNRVLFTLRQLLDAAGIDPNPARAVPMVKPGHYTRVPDCLDYREDILLLRAARRTWRTRRTGVRPQPLAKGYAYAVYLLMRFFGLRPDEVQYLTWEDVLDDRIVVQAKRVGPSETHERFADGWWMPKDYALRVVDPPHARLIIADLRRRTPRSGRFVVGGPRVLHDVPRVMLKLLRRIGSRRAPYDLRHTFATWALTYYQGQPGDVLVRVQRWMGHSSPATTMRYLHVVPRIERHPILRHFRRAAALSTPPVDTGRPPEMGTTGPLVRQQRH